MEKFSRSKSSREGGGMQPRNMNDLRSYSTSDYNPPQNIDQNFKEVKIINKGKKSRMSVSSKNLSLNLGPELQRKKRVAGYKAYGVEGKMKTSLRKSFRWVKDTCNNVIHGFW